MEFRVVGPGDEAILAEVFTEIDATFFRPHPFTPEEARRIAFRSGHNMYAAMVDGDRLSAALAVIVNGSLRSTRRRGRGTGLPPNGS